MTSYFDVYSPSVAEYEDEDIPKIHLTAEEPPWVPSMSEYSDREIIMVRSVSLTQWQGEQYLSAQLSDTHWLMMPLTFWIMTNL